MAFGSRPADFRLSYSARTDVGRRREHNEDAVWSGPLPADQHGSAACHLFVVADGVGGRQRGEWASQNAVTLLQRELADCAVPRHSSVSKGQPARTQHPAPSDRGAALRLAIEAVNRALWQQEANNPDYQGAATTLVVVLICGRFLWWANVGDSRAYLGRGGRAHQLTRDHSWVEEQVRAGQMTPEQARSSTRRNIITRSIGPEPEVVVDVGGPLALQGGDHLLLCSDGLHGEVSDEEMVEIMCALTVEAATARLIALSNERGGPDNISVIVCAVQGIDEADENGSARFSLSRIWRLLSNR